MPKRTVKKTARSTRKKSYPAHLYIYIVSTGSLLVAAIALFVLTTLGLIHNPCANAVSCIKDLTGTPEIATTGVFEGKLVQAPKIETDPPTAVLGDSTISDKHIYVNLTNQTLEAKENGATVLSFPVSTGKWGPTPTGDFRIWIKLKYTRMTGGEKSNGTFYDLPNVPYTMYFYNAQVPKSMGYGLHGAYWHNNFGHPMSHGCVNISPDNAKKLFDWANPPTTGFTTFATDENPGTAITIFGVAPKS